MALSGAPRDGSTEPPSVATVGFTSNFRFPSEAAIRSAWAAYELCAGIKKGPFGPACPGHPHLQMASRKKTWVPGTRPGTGLAPLYGRATGPRESGIVAAFSFQSFDHGVTGRGASTPSTRIASTCSLKKHR